MAIIDGDEGLVVLDPDAPTLERYRKHAAERTARFQGLARLADLPAETLDGGSRRALGQHRVPRRGRRLPRARGRAASGSTGPSSCSSTPRRPPTEDEQFEAYAAVVRAMGGRPVTIRTLDLGADKLAAYRGATAARAQPGAGPAEPAALAPRPGPVPAPAPRILRASALGDVRILFPLVSTLAEFRQARAILDEVAAELSAEGVAVRANCPSA